MQVGCCACWEIRDKQRSYASGGCIASCLCQSRGAAVWSSRVFELFGAAHFRIIPFDNASLERIATLLLCIQINSVGREGNGCTMLLYNANDLQEYILLYI